MAPLASFVYKTVPPPVKMTRSTAKGRSLYAIPWRSAMHQRAAVPTKFESFDKMLESFENKVALVGMYNLGVFDSNRSRYSLPCITDFYAQWCGPCKLMVPVLEEFAINNSDRIAVAKVDTDKYPSLGSRFNVEGGWDTRTFAAPTLLTRISLFRFADVHCFQGAHLAEYIPYYLSR
jgi:thiol-disulfide isomerase/thioredoxin